MDTARKPVLLLILDGWGLGPDPSNSAIELANTPTWDKLWTEWPRSQLVPHGENVGLTEGQMGNSEVGHLNIGAGRVVYQDLVAIGRMITEGRLADHERLNAFLDGVGDGTLHFVGLFSDGGVHSHLDHLYGVAEYAAQRGVERMCVHALLDGRDTPADIAERYFVEAEQRLPAGCGFATLGGRYFGMDRDQRWHRTDQAYKAIVCGEGAWAADWRQALANARSWGITDEFVPPTVLGGFTGMEDGDSVLCFNFRADRMRQLVAALTLSKMEGFERLKRPETQLFTFTHYRDDFNHPVLLTYEPVEETLTEVCSRAGLRVYKSAETEKYAHVTYFLNGGREEPWPGENRLLIPSPKVATYDLKPEMSLPEVTDALLQALGNGYDLLVVNYANGDMVGHTGVERACIAAAEAVDASLARVLEACEWGRKINVVVTADHGNCDVLRWPDGSPHTQHSMSDVPLVLVAEPRMQLCGADESPRLARRRAADLHAEMAHANHDAGESLDDDGHPSRWALCDIAPTVLELLGLEAPRSWTGISLLRR